MSAARSRRVYWLAVPAILFLFWLVLYPNLFVLRDSVQGDGGLSASHYARFFASRAEREALWNSVWISLASVVASG